MVVLVLMQTVMGQQFGSMRLTVVMTVIIDDDRHTVIADDATTECLGEQPRDQHR